MCAFVKSPSRLMDETILHGGSGVFFGNLISSFRWLLCSLMDISGMFFFLSFIYLFLVESVSPFLFEWISVLQVCLCCQRGRWTLSAVVWLFYPEKKTDTNFVLLFYCIPSNFVFFLLSLRPIPSASLTSKESPSQWMLTWNKVTAKMCNKFCVCVESSLNCLQSKREKKSYNINKTLHIVLGIGNCLNLRSSPTDSLPLLGLLCCTTCHTFHALCGVRTNNSSREQASASHTDWSWCYRTHCCGTLFRNLFFCCPFRMIVLGESAV